MPTTEEENQNQTPAVAEPLGDAGIKALQAEREARKQAEQALAAQKAQWDTERATLSQQLTEAANKATEEAEKATAKSAEAAREKVLRLKKVPDVLEEFVTGATPEELEASADKVLAAFTQAGTKAGKGMAPDPSQGAHSPASDGDKDIDARIAAAEKEGNKDLVKHLKAMKLGEASRSRL